jgi:putative transcriptional regulator
VSGFSRVLLYSHEPGEPRAPGIEITPTLSVSPSRELLEAAARGELDNSFELLLGYAGWAPGQLDSELERGSWLHAAFDEDVLSAAVDDRWDEIFASLGLSPAGFMTVPGGAQA